MMRARVSAFSASRGGTRCSVRMRAACSSALRSESTLPSTLPRLERAAVEDARTPHLAHVAARVPLREGVAPDADGGDRLLRHGLLVDLYALGDARAHGVRLAIQYELPRREGATAGEQTRATQQGRAPQG